MSTPEKTWWYAASNQKYGPYTQDELRELARSGQFTGSDLVWQRGTPDWVVAASVAGLVPDTTLADSPPVAFPAPPAQEPAHTNALAAAPAGAPLPAKPDSAANAETPNPLAIFVGPNYAYYAQRWAHGVRQHNMLSWNWAAFFLGLFWMAYRKMYLYCAIFIGVVATFTGMAFALNLPQPAMQAVLQGAQVGFALFFGLFGNQIYQGHAQKKLRQIAAQHPPQHAQKQWAVQGGTSLVAVIGVALGMVLAMMATSVILSLFMGKQV